MAVHSLDLSVLIHTTLAVHDSAPLEAAQSVAPIPLIPTVNQQCSLSRIAFRIVAYSSAPRQADAPNLLDWDWQHRLADLQFLAEKLGQMDSVKDPKFRSVRSRLPHQHHLAASCCRLVCLHAQQCHSSGRTIHISVRCAKISVKCRM